MILTHSVNQHSSHGLTALRCIALAALVTLAAGCQSVVQSPPIVTEQGVLLGPPRCDEGGVIRMQTRSIADGDVYSTDDSGRASVQRMVVERERVMERETLDRSHGLERKVELRILEDHVRTTLAGSNALAEGRAPGPLAARVLVGKRVGAEANWSYALDEGSPEPDQAEELSALSAYENRDWFSTERVQVGDEWKMDTAYLEHVLKRDLPEPTLVAKARLEEVRAGTARISVSIRGEGHKELPGGGRSAATLELDGTLLVDLDTLLDRRLELGGILETAATSGRAGSQSRMPMEILVEKSWLRR